MESALNVILGSNAEKAAREVIDNYESYDLRTLVIPYGHKDLFGVCAEVLSQLPIDVFDSIAVETTRWLQDLNWPGCDLIENKLRQLPKQRLQQIVVLAIEEAKKEHDEEWAFNLSEVFADCCP